MGYVFKIGFRIVKMKIIAEGAEAKIYKNKNTIIKDRIKKDYRLPVIDVLLRKSRTRSEAKLIREAERAGVNVTAVLEQNDKTYKLHIEFLDGEKVRDILDKNWKLGEQIGEQVWKSFLKTYTNDKVLKHLKKVEARGRYKKLD